MASKIEFQISRNDLEELHGPWIAEITDVDAISSYNWIDADESTPTISVPGSPPLWTAPKNGMQLQQDYGLVYINQNAARHPRFPLEPLLRALFITERYYDVSTTDVITDRGNLTKLLSFIRMKQSWELVKPFTIEAEIVKDTLILKRCEASNVEFIGASEFRGFGRQFQNKCTTSLISKSTSHHRILGYKFGGLKLLVRHEVDCYVDKEQEFNAEGLARTFTMYKGKDIPVLSNPYSPLHIRLQGQSVPFLSIVEIKTKSSHLLFQDQEIMPQMYFGQTFKLVKAYHTRGWFEAPEVQNKELRVDCWEGNNQPLLRTLVGLLREIKVLTNKCGGKAFIHFGGNDSDLCIREAEMDDMLPEDLYLEWGIQKQSTIPSDDEDRIPVIHSSKDLGAVETNATRASPESTTEAEISDDGENVEN